MFACNIDEFIFEQLENSSEVIAAAMANDNIRFMRVGLHSSTTPLSEPTQVFPWQQAQNGQSMYH